MNKKLIESVANRQLFCDLFDILNALHDSKEMILHLEGNNEYDEYTRGYCSALDCSIKLLNSIIDSYIDYIKVGDL